MLYNPTDFATLVQGAKSMPESGKMIADAIIFVPETEQNNDGYINAHRYLLVKDKDNKKVLYDGGVTDIGPSFEPYNVARSLPFNKVNIDFVPGGIAMRFDNEKVLVDCHLNSITNIYFVDK